jgi:hypothetical protein
MKASAMTIVNSIFKTFVLSLLVIAQVHFAYAQNAAILPPAKTTFVDQNGKPLTSGTVDFYIPGTNTRKTTWQDSAGTIPNSNPVQLDAAGRALILGNGAYRQVVKDRLGNQQWDQVTNSAGAGGSGAVTVGDGNAVGAVLPFSGLVAPSNYAFPYGQELSRATYTQLLNAITLTQSATCVSGNSTITAVADTSQLSVGTAVEAACIPAGATVVSKTASTVTLTANASVSVTTSATFYPWGNGNGLTTFNAPDLRGVVLPGRNNMGGAASVKLSPPYYTDPNSLSGSGGSQSSTLLASNLPPYTPAGTIVTTVTPAGTYVAGTAATTVSAGAITVPTGNTNPAYTAASTFTGSSALFGGIAVSATVGAGGSGYSAGTQLLTVTGGTCTTQPQFNITTSAGAITAPVLVTAGLCSVAPTNPAATSGGGGTGGTLNIIYSAVPFSNVQPSKTINYIVKVLPDVNLSIARCANLIDAGTSCTYNVGTSGNTIPLNNTANSFSAAQTFSAGVAISGGATSITALNTPVNPTDAATKAYVDSVATGLNILSQSRLATAAVLPNTPTYSNGALGVGATLTAGSNTTLTVDGTVAALNDIILVKNQASAFQNGVYTVTAAGSGAAPWVLTRATYFDQAAEMKAGSYTLVTAGSINASTSWALQTAVTTVGTDALTWIQFSSTAGVTSVGGFNGVVTAAQVTSSCNLFTGVLSGCIPSGSGTTSISQLNPVTQTWVTPTALTIQSRTTAASLNLTNVNVIKTLGYATAGDGGGATFVRRTANGFLDSRILTGSITNAGAGYVNATYLAVDLTGGSGTNAQASITVAGGIVTSVTLRNTGGNGYIVGDVLSASNAQLGGAGAGFTYTVGTVSTPLASFTDAGANRWQIVADAGNFVNVKQFGAKVDYAGVDASATDDYAAIQAAYNFASIIHSPTIDGGGSAGAKVIHPAGNSLVCGSVPLLVPQGVSVEGHNMWASTLKMCTAWDPTQNFMTICDPNMHNACFASRLHNITLYSLAAQTANAGISMVYSNNIQQVDVFERVAIYSGARRCITLETGYGGAALLGLQNVECTPGNSVNVGILINYGSTLVNMRNVHVETGAAMTGSGIAITGGFVELTGFHTEGIPTGIEVNIPGSANNGIARLFNISGGNGCTNLVLRQGAGAANVTVVGNAIKNGCTNTVNNAGALTTTPVVMNTLY